jgi:hypothetical protein
LCSGKCNIRGNDVSEKPPASIFRDETGAMIMTPIFALQKLAVGYKELNGVAFLKDLTYNVITDTKCPHQRCSIYLPCCGAIRVKCHGLMTSFFKQTKRHTAQ